MKLRTAISAVAALLLAAAVVVIGGTGASASNAKNDGQTICMVYGAAAGPAAHGGTEVTAAATYCYQGVAAYVQASTDGNVSVSDSTSLSDANAAINQYMAQRSPQVSSNGGVTPFATTLVAHGCDGVSFAPTCWNFAVPGTVGCNSTTSWHWGTLSMDNQLSSWTADGTCSHGILYDLPYEPSGSVKITCYTCYSLGGMDNKTSSLGVYY